jgi:hypothetical protein
MTTSPKTKKAKYRDPHTGDNLTLAEHISWMIQNVIRNWFFIGLITIATITCWLINTDLVLRWWNFVASYLALFIESVVGIAMFSQTRRDAMIIREIRKFSTSDFEVHKESLKMDEKVHRDIVEIIQRLDSLESYMFPEYDEDINDTER